MDKYSKKKALKVWLVIAVLVLIILLLVWLTIADLWGDTDVAAFISASVLPAML